MKTRKFLTISFAALLLGACNKSGEITDPNAGNDGEASVSIFFSNGTGGGPSKATDAGSDAERKITQLEFFIFDPNGINDAKTPYLKLDAYQYKTLVNIASSGQVRFVVVANASPTIGGAANYADLQSKLAKREFTASESISDHNARTVPAAGFEMTGQTVVAITAGSSDNTATVGLDRLVSKFGMPVFATATSGFLKLPDVDLEKLWGAGTMVTNADMTFTFDGYALVNGVNKSMLLYRNDWETPPATWKEKWVDWYNTNETGMGLKYLNSTFEADGNYKNNYSGQQNASWFLGAKVTEEPLYVYENAPEVISTNAGSGYNAQKVYAFIIKGTLTANAGLPTEKTATRYWRVNLIPESDYQIYRNKSYKVTVTAIKSCGYDTPGEAEKNSPIVPMDGETYVDIIVTVNPWEVILSSTEM